MATIDYNYIITDICVLDEYRGCKNVLAWVEIVYQAVRTDPDNPEFNLKHNNKSLTIDVFNEETFDPNNFLDKDEVTNEMVRQWTDANIPLSYIAEWQQTSEKYFDDCINKIIEGRNITTVDAPWIQISPT